MYNEDIFELAGDINTPNTTPEWHKANDFYGNAHILKQYAGLPADYPLKAVIEHGPTFPGEQWEHDLQAPFPMLCTFNTGAAQYIYNTTGKLPIVTGPMIAYAQPYLPENETKNLKKKLGKNLLVYPFHATHHSYNELHHENILSQIKKEEKNYDSVTINIYWADVTKDIVNIYSSHGYHCTTCGHIYDNLFLNRQKTLLDLSDGVIVFGFMTSIYFAAYSGKKIKVCDKAATIHRDEVDEQTFLKNQEKVGEKREKYFSTVKKLFQKMTPPIGAQEEILSYVCESSQVKTPEEIRSILALAEEMYTLPQIFGLKRYAHPLEMLQAYKKIGQEEKKQQLYSYLQKIDIL